VPARNIRAPRDSIILGTKAREHIQAYVLIKRLQQYVLIDPDNPKPGDIRLTRTQAFIALALLKKVLPDLASVEIAGNQEKPLLVQVVRFSDGEQLEPARPILDISKLIEADATNPIVAETEAAAAAEAEVEAEVPRKRGRKSGSEWLGRRQLKLRERSA